MAGKIYKSIIPSAEEMAKNPRILILDDDPEFIQMATRFLHTSGHFVESFEHPQEAIQELEKNTYDVLLLDIGLPDLDGFEVSKRLHSQIPIVMVSTDRDTQKLVELKEHYDAYVDKKNLFIHLLPTVHIAIKQWGLKNNAA